MKGKMLKANVYFALHINFAKLEKFRYKEKQPQGFTPCGFLCVQKVQLLTTEILQA